MNIIPIYNELEPLRRPYLDDAADVAQIVNPDIDVLGKGVWRKTSRNADLKAVSRPYSTMPAYAIGQLASTLQAYILPTNSNWFLLDAPVDVRITLQIAQSQGKVPAGFTNAIRANAQQSESLVLEKMAEHDLHGKLGNFLERLLIEGQGVVHVTDNFTRFMPLRSFVVKRDSAARAIQLIIKEDYADATDAYELYTYVDYTEGKVYQQKEGDENAKVIEDTPDQYFVAATTIDDNKDYATSIGSKFYANIYTVNFLSKKIQEITNWAALNIVALSQALDITVEEFQRKLENGENIFSAPVTPDGRLEGIGFISAASKLADLAALTNELRRQEEMLSQAFSLGIVGQTAALQGRERVTAQEIYARSNDVNASAQSQAATLMSTFQRPLVNAYLSVLGIALTLNDGRATIQPVILAGANTLSRMVKVNQLLGSVDAIAAIPQTPWTQGLDRNALFLEVTNAQGYPDAQRFFLQQQQQPPQSTGGTA